MTQGKILKDTSSQNYLFELVSKKEVRPNSVIMYRHSVEM